MRKRTGHRPAQGLERLFCVALIFAGAVVLVALTLHPPEGLFEMASLDFIRGASDASEIPWWARILFAIMPFMIYLMIIALMLFAIGRLAGWLRQGTGGFGGSGGGGGF